MCFLKNEFRLQKVSCTTSHALIMLKTFSFNPLTNLSPYPPEAKADFLLKSKTLQSIPVQFIGYMLLHRVVHVVMTCGVQHSSSKNHAYKHTNLKYCFKHTPIIWFCCIICLLKLWLWLDLWPTRLAPSGAFSGHKSWYSNNATNPFLYTCD